MTFFCLLKNHTVTLLINWLIIRLGEREERDWEYQRRKNQIWKYCKLKKIPRFRSEMWLMPTKKNAEEIKIRKKCYSSKIMHADHRKLMVVLLIEQYVEPTSKYVSKLKRKTSENKNGICRVFGLAFIFTSKKSVLKWSQCGSFIKMKSENYREVNAFYHAHTNTLKWEKSRRGEKKQHSHYFCGDDDWHTAEIHTRIRSVWKLENKTSPRNWYFE